MRAIRNIIVLLCAAGIVLLVPILWANRQPIQIDIVRLNPEQVVSQEEQKQRQVAKKQNAAHAAKLRKIYGAEQLVAMQNEIK